MQLGGAEYIHVVAPLEVRHCDSHTYLYKSDENPSVLDVHDIEQSGPLLRLLLFVLLMASSRKADKPTSQPDPPTEELSKGSQRHPWRLLFWHEIPSWQKDNEFILSGYRSVSRSFLFSFGKKPKNQSKCV